MASIKITKEELDKLTFGIESLDQTQRELVRHELKQMRDRTGGILYEESVRKELSRMKNEGEISDVDVRNIVEALFG
jgi:hypothetical protein